MRKFLFSILVIAGVVFAATSCKPKAEAAETEVVPAAVDTTAIAGDNVTADTVAVK